MVSGAARRADARWRVFLSHTSELREFPRGRSYVSAVERAVAACGHVVVDMADFPAADLPPARLCTDRVESCEVYIGLLGTRYGSPVRDRPEVSYTELEFEAATEAGLHRLVFMLDMEAEVTGIPPSGLIDLEFGGRQEAFRRRVQAGLGTRSFADPGTLGQLAERSLRELAGGHQAGDTAVLPVRLAPRPEFLVGRDSLLGELDARLADGSGQAGPRLAVLCGLGGAGKTSVAVEYAHRHLAEVGVCWQFPAEDPALLEAEFAVLAAQLGVRDLEDARDPVTSVHGALARSGAPWLLVFDNAVDRSSVEPFLPPAGNGRVLVTTQSQHWPARQALDVPVLDTRVAADFLTARTGDGDRAAARELAAGLGGLPLALEQAAAYMQATGTTLARYLPLFRDRQADLLARGEAAGHPADVTATLGLALSRLSVQAPAAAGLLRLLAFLAPDPVPLSLLLAGGQAAGRLPAEAARINRMLGDPVAAGDAVAALRRYSLLSPAGDGLVLVHRLVQAVTRAQLTTAAAAQWQQAAAALIEAAVPADSLAPITWPACALLLPHARGILDLTSDGMGRIAQYLGESGSYPAARDLFRLIADALAADSAHGPEHPDTLAARSHLARWTRLAGDPASARDQLAALLPVRERILGPHHPHILADRSALARWTAVAGDPASARDQLAALLPVRERISGPEHPDTLTARYHLASGTGRAGDPIGARDQFAGLLSDRERISGPDHPHTLSARANFAYWTGEAGDAVSARDQFAALLPLRERVLGPNHPSILNTRRNLAYWTGVAGDAVSARDQFAALLPLHERISGPDHHDTMAIRRELAHWAEKASG
jgi:hypothetical protein